MPITKLAIIEAVSQDLKLRYRGTGSGSAGTQITAVDLADIFSDALAPMAAYLAPVGSVAFRRIANFDGLTGLITLNRAGVANGPVDCWIILNPNDWREIVDDALSALYFTDRFVVPPVAGTSLYSLAASTWLHNRSQVEGVYYQWTSGATVQNKPVPSYELIQDANAVSVNINSVPSDVTNLQFVVEARHFYEPLTLDSDSTTCPDALIKAQTKVEALRRVWTVMGEREAKELFGKEVQQAQAELLDRKKLLIPQTHVSPIRVDAPQPGPEMAMPSYRW